MTDVNRRHDSYTVGTFIKAFLADWTASLLSVAEQQELIDLFGDLSEECLSGSDLLDQWGSDLTTDGVPVEFSCVADADGTASVRFIVDPQTGPQGQEQARAQIARNSRLTVPAGAAISQLIDMLTERHLAGVTDFNRAFVGYGARFSPGKSRASRLYFKTWWVPSWKVHATLADLIESQDLRRFRSSFLGPEQIQGVGYDFTANGLARVKVYLQVDISPKDVGSAFASILTGLNKTLVNELTGLITNAATVSPPPSLLLIGVGFAPVGDYCDLKICFPAVEWGWRTFRAMMPALSAVLRHWHLPEDFSLPKESMDVPLWHFVPTWLSLDFSPQRDGLSVYFKPTKERPVSRVQLVPRSERGKVPRSNRQMNAFEIMFSKLLACDSPAVLDRATR